MLIETHLNTQLRPHPSLGPDYSICDDTKLIYNMKASFAPAYEKDYFNTEYKEQYGKTYLEDEIQLRSLAKKRLQKMKPYLSKEASIFELGCAYGFFLDEATRAGYSSSGIDISQETIQYAKNKLKAQAFSSTLIDFNLLENSLDAICAFYVIEHIPQQKTYFKKIATSLKKGGIFAFALPSIYGPLFRHHPQKWLSTHPKDHFVDYSPKSIKKVLTLYDLSLVKLWPPSFHPERLKFYPKFYTKTKLFSSIYKIYAQALSYGDTIEGIAIKK